MEIKNQQKIRPISVLRKYLNEQLMEREDLIDICLAAMINGDHVFMLGPPGVAKSYLAEKMTEFMGYSSNVNLFTFQFNKDTKSEDLFGAPDINEFKAGRYRRNTDGFLPTANIAVLDEIWKGGPVLNGLLRVLNERRFRNGSTDEIVPLQFAVAASNELPEDSSLNALYDRFLWRVFVDYIEDSDNFVDLASKRLNRIKERTPEEFMRDNGIDPNEVSLENIVAKYRNDLSVDESKDRKYVFTEELIRSSHRLAKILRQNGIPISDRRLLKSLEGVRALYYVRRCSISSDIFYSMINTIWSTPEQAATIRKIVVDPNNNFISAAARNSFNIVQSIELILEKLKNNQITPQSAFAEMKNIEGKLSNLPPEDRNNDLYIEAIIKAKKAIIQTRTLV